jgi:hypothetical protein
MLPVWRKAPMTINARMAALVAELEEGGHANPLAERSTLANVWASLARLAREELPAAALGIVGHALDVTYEPMRRGGNTDHAEQFAPAD